MDPRDYRLWQQAQERKQLAERSAIIAAMQRTLDEIRALETTPVR